MASLSSSARLAEQIGGHGYFAEVSLSADVVPADQDALSIEISPRIDTEWYESLRLGLRLGWRHLPSKHRYRKHQRIFVESLHTNPVDTSEIGVLYVAAKALLALFDEKPRNAPTFVKEFGVFMLPS